MVVDKTRRASGWRVLLALGVMLSALFLGEVGYRLYGAARGAPYDADETQAAINSFAQRMTNRFDAVAQGQGRTELRAIEDQGMAMIPHPFFAFDFVHKQEQLTGDVDYFSRTKSAQGRGTPGFDVLILGGSVAAEYRKGGVEHMLELLRADPRLAGRRLREFVYARGSGKQPQQLNILAYLLSLGFAPDAVINLDGFNEVALATTNQMNGVHPLHPAYRYWLHLTGAQALDTEAVGFLLDMKTARRRVEELAADGQRWGLGRSALLGRLVLARLNEAQSVHHAAYDSYSSHLASLQGTATASGPEFSGDTAEAISLGVRSWFEGSLNMQAICDAHDIIYLHALQPTLHDSGSKEATERELRVGRTGKGWRTAAISGYPKLRAAGEELVVGGVNFLDTSMVFRGERGELYNDACHFNERGNRLLAERLAQALLALLP
jgi:hypothetical protein